MTGVVAASVLALSVIGGGTASASPPGWTMVVKYAPSHATVQPGANAGYIVTIANGGRSNISALFLGTDIPATAPNAGSPTYVGSISYVGQAGVGACNEAGDGPLYCDFGNLVAGASVTVTVAFETSTTGSGCTPDRATKYCFNFLAYGNGNTPSDGGTSHGDTLKGPASVTLNSSGNFAGGFSTNTGIVSNAPSLSKKNVQAGAVTPPAANIAVTIEDGLADDAFSCTVVPACANRFGEWTRLNIDNGKPVAGGFKVVITIYGQAVPNRATVDTIVLIHVDDAGTVYPISLRCGPTTLPFVAGVECITVTKVGNNFQIVAWLLGNGGTRGGY